MAEDVFEWMHETGCNGMMQNEIFAKAIMILKKEIKEKRGLDDVKKIYD